MNNATNWLRLLFHAMTCAPRDGYVCSLDERCVDARRIVRQVLNCDQQPHATAVRRLLLHFVSCTDEACDMCSELSADLSGRPADAAANQQPAAMDDDDGDDDDDDMDNSDEDDVINVAARRASAAAASASAARPAAGASAAADPAASSSASAASQGAPPNSSAPAAYDSEAAQLAATVHHLVWLLHHAMRRASALAPPTESAPASTMSGGQLWQHVLTCQVDATCERCTTPSCLLSKHLLLHRVECGERGCRLCDPVADHFRRPTGPVEAMRGGLDADAVTAVLNRISLMHI